VFMVGYENNSDTLIATVRYGGQLLTRINGTVVNGSDRIELWYLKEAGITAATANTFVVTYGGTTPSNQLFAAATYRNVDQTAPVSASGVNSVNAATPNPLPLSIAVTADGIAIGAEVSADAGTFTWGNGWTEGTDQAASSSKATSADHPETANGTDTAAATDSNQHRVAIVAVSLAVAH
jgi:hypothetical protein